MEKLEKLKMNDDTKDTVMPDGKWTFDGDVTDVFDDMLARSIPQYDVMRKACSDVALRYARHGTDIVDLGCSRGEAVAMLVDELGAYCTYTCIDVSDPMLEACRERFATLIEANRLTVKNLDLRKEYPRIFASVTLCVLTLQFTPIEYRQRIVKNIYDHTVEGGALVIVEKVLGADADIDEMMVDLYYGMKHDHGYTQEQIERKRLSLEGVLVPVTARWNEELLRMAGFSSVDCFWRWMNFAGWIAVK